MGCRVLRFNLLEGRPWLHRAALRSLNVGNAGLEFINLNYYYYLKNNIFIWEKGRLVR